jgi:hypothetical protein
MAKQLIKEITDSVSPTQLPLAVSWLDVVCDSAITQITMCKVFCRFGSDTY